MITKFWTLIFIIIFFNSCSDYSEVRESVSGFHIIDPEPINIEESENHVYNVGRDRLTVISKGLQVIFDLPLINLDTLKKLEKKYQFDSWIYEVIRFKSGSQQKLHSFYVPFVFKRNEINHQAKKSGFFLMYAALYPSTEYERAACPVMGHNKVIENHEVASTHVPKSFRTIDLSTYNVRSYNGRPEKAHYSLNKVNAGSSLVGEYHIRIALFNQKANKVVSNYIDYPDKVIVREEGTRLLKGCDLSDTRFPERKDKPGIESFKFGR